MNSISPSILLLGGGYTLQRTASLLPLDSFVITSRNEQRVIEWRERGWQARVLDLAQPQNISTLFNTYPTLNTVVDSVPPDDFTYGDPSDATHRVKTLLEGGIKKVIYLSTTGVFGVEDGSWVNEDTPLNPQNPRSQARILFEEAYLSHVKDVTILRISAIYGPGRGIGTALKEMRYPLIGQGDRWSNRIHVDDLAQIILKVTTSKSPSNLYCISDGQPANVADVIDFYCSEFNLPYPESITLEEAKRRNLYTLLSNQRIDSRRFFNDFPFDLQYPSFREGAKTEFHLSR